MTIVYKLWNTSGLADSCATWARQLIMSLNMTDPFISAVQQETLNLIQSGNHYFITRVMWMVSLTMMTYDYGLTIEDEIQFVWHGNRIALSRILFLANRYWPMANLIINNILLATVATSHTRFCRVWFNAVAYSAFPIHVSIGTIQILRLHAMYSRNRMLLFVMCTLLALDLGVGTVIIGIVAYNIRPVVLPPGFTGCVLSHIAPYAWVYWLPMLIMESLLFVLSVVKSLDSMQNNMKMPHIMSVLFRDSVFYFAGVLGSIVLNFVVWNVARTTLFSAFLP
ncbi:hypothetical protein B0H21DRAFT_732475 [Amylocystis lapponica]|nr:hypothetical protein B0H21DRAFT_732475 [Amylocystis lapponica]